MSFLGTMQARSDQAKKAAAYDNIVKENEYKIIYQKGLADSVNKLASTMAEQSMGLPAPVGPGNSNLGIPAPQPSLGLAKPNVLK